MTRKTIKILKVIALAALCTLAGSWVTVTDASFVDVLVLPFMAIVAGIAVGASVFVVQSVDSAKQRAMSSMSSGNPIELTKWKELEALFDNGVAEVQQDFAIILILALASVGLAIWSRADVPYIEWQPILLTKIQALHAAAFFFSVLSIWAVWDIVDTMFELRKVKAVADAHDDERSVR